MSHSVAEQLLQRLVQWGVRRIYGYPGDGINGIMGAFAKHEGKDLEFIQARHEEMAAFMACGHAKFTGEVGVCLATSGPGAIHLLNGLYDAKLDHQPVVAIVGQAAMTAMGGSYQQEVDLASLFKDVCHEFVFQASVPQQVEHLIDRAMRIARVERTPTCVIVPHDLQEEKYEPPGREHGMIQSSIGVATPRVIPRDEDLRAAAAILNAGKKVAMLVGAGCMFAGTEVLQVAEVLGAGIAKALLGKAVLADDHPHVTGAIGLLGTKPSFDLMQECDTLLMVGTSFPYSEFLPKPGQARGVQIDLDGRMLGIRYPTELNLIGDAAETLRALLPFLKRNEDRSFREQIEKNVREWWELLEKRAMIEAKPINPQRVFWELSPRLPDDTILCADSGSAANWFARDLKIRSGMMASLSGGLATMGAGVPYAIAGKFAFPNRPVIAMVGDGAMQMNGNNGLITIAKYWKEWADPRLVILVLNNRDLNQVTWEMRAMEGDAKFSSSQDLPDFPYARYAEMLGLIGLRVDKPEDLGQAWEIALASNRPVVLEAITDPDVPPLPPHITLAQAKSFMSSILHGDPNRGGFIKQALKNMFP